MYINLNCSMMICFNWFRSLWGKENKLSSEIERLKSEVAKAEKSLDQATPGVSNHFPVLVLRSIVLYVALRPLDTLVCAFSYND